MQVEVMDFEQRVRNKIRVEGNFPGFPQPERYNLEKSEIDDYLMDKQLALDSGGSARTQDTIMGVMIILPVIVFSAFPQKEMPGGNWAIFVAIAIGLGLAGLVKLIVKARIKSKLRNIYDPRIERYIDDVLNFNVGS